MDQNHQLFNLDASTEKIITFQASGTSRDYGHGKLEETQQERVKRQTSNSAKQNFETTIPRLLRSHYKT